jgi:hypothetical protein
MRDETAVTEKVSISSGARQLWIRRVAVALFAIGLMAVFAFSQLFTVFPPWDDEGYFLQAYRDFLSGRALYNQVFAIYGPFTFFSAGLVARFNAANVTHDTFRWIVLPVWLMIAAIFGVVAWRWTRQFAVSLALLLLVGFRLRGLARGIGHPQLWIILAVALLLWVGLEWAYQRAASPRAFWTGILIGAILLFKINIGIFVLLAVALTIGLQFKQWRGRFVCGLLLLACSCLGLMMFLQSSTASEKLFVFAYLTSLAATVNIAIRRAAVHDFPRRAVICFGVGIAVCLTAGLGATVALGTTPRALFEGLIAIPMVFARKYHNPFLNATEPASLIICAVGVCVLFTMPRWRRIAGLGSARLGLAKAALGAALLCAFYYDHRIALTGSLLFLWLLIFDVPEFNGPMYFNRLLLALLSPLLSLQLFPMAGEQVDWAALGPMLAAAVLLGDGVNSVVREHRDATPRLRTLVSRAPGMLVALFLLATALRTGLQFRRWLQYQPVNLTGTHWLRLPPREAERLTVTVGLLRRNCETVLTLPGLYSFPLWSGVPPAEEKRFNTWPFLWPDEVQNNELPELQGKARGCVLVSQDVYDFFRGYAVSPGTDALLKEIRQTMRPIAAVQDLTLYRSSAVSQHSPKEQNQRKSDSRI